MIEKRSSLAILLGKDFETNHGYHNTYAKGYIPTFSISLVYERERKSGDISLMEEDFAHVYDMCTYKRLSKYNSVCKVKFLCLIVIWA